MRPISWLCVSPTNLIVCEYKYVRRAGSLFGLLTSVGAVRPLAFRLAFMSDEHPIASRDAAHLSLPSLSLSRTLTVASSMLLATWLSAVFANYACGWGKEICISCSWFTQHLPENVENLKICALAYESSRRNWFSAQNYRTQPIAYFQRFAKTTGSAGKGYIIGFLTLLTMEKDIK